MSSPQKTKTDSKLDASWQLLVSLLSLLVMLLILTLGYLLLHKDIQNYLNRKVYSKEELIGFSKGVAQRKAEGNFDKVENGIHLRTGLHADPHLETIIASCTSCHSAKLITQNRATRAGWSGMIRWMQKTQGLPDLGDREPIILDYLAKYYKPEETGRRMNLEVQETEWYVLELE